MPRIKVQGGTVKGEPLCKTCANGQIMEDHTGEIITWCHDHHYAPMLITKPVMRCTSFHERNRPSLAVYKEVAWFITTDKKTGKIGFITPADRKGLGDKERRALLDMPDPLDED